MPKTGPIARNTARYSLSSLVSAGSHRPARAFSNRQDRKLQNSPRHVPPPHSLSPRHSGAVHCDWDTTWGLHTAGRWMPIYNSKQPLTPPSKFGRHVRFRTRAAASHSYPTCPARRIPRASTRSPVSLPQRLSHRKRPSNNPSASTAPSSATSLTSRQCAFHSLTFHTSFYPARWRSSSTAQTHTL